MTKTPLKIKGISNSLYAGFWLRLGSLLLDFVIILPVTVTLLYINSLALTNYLYTFIPSLIFGLWYNIYLVQKYGGTPGKLIVGIKIIATDGNKIKWEHAILRHIVLIILSLLSIFIMIRSIGLADEAYFNSLSWMQKNQYLVSYSPILFSIYTWSSNVWVYGELIVLLTNKRKRAVHDFIAGTVIIKKEYEESIKNNLID